MAKIELMHWPTAWAPPYRSWSSYDCCPMLNWPLTKAETELLIKYHVGSTTTSVCPRLKGDPGHRIFSVKLGTIPDKPSIKETKQPIDDKLSTLYPSDPGRDSDLPWLKLPQILDTGLPFLPTKFQWSSIMPNRTPWSIISPQTKSHSVAKNIWQ